jgi:hypothetical protein
VLNLISTSTIVNYSYIFMYLFYYYTFMGTKTDKEEHWHLDEINKERKTHIDEGGYIDKVKLVIFCLSSEIACKTYSFLIQTIHSYLDLKSIDLLWAYMMMVILETRRAHTNLYRHVYSICAYILWLRFGNIFFSKMPVLTSDFWWSMA